MSYTSGKFAAQAKQVAADDKAGRPENTILAYRRKMSEFLDFSRYAFPSEVDGIPSTTVTEEKFFGFLWYQSRRHQRPRGRPGQCKPVEEQFSKDDYESVISNTDWISDKPIGYSVLNQYRSAILDLHSQQRDGGCNNIPKEVLMSGRVKRLLKTVKMRKTQIAKSNFDEKLTSEFTPYTAAQDIPRLEDFFFQKNSLSSIYSVASLRDRYCLLMTTNGILRGESLFKCELSDLCSLLHKDKNSLEDILIHVMRIATGKTNGLKTLYGRCIRHRNVNECAIGALGFYLMARFMQSGEAESFDFTSNKAWFNIKLLTDSRGFDNTISVTDQAYASNMKNACRHLGIISKHFVHFGRSAGSVKAELDELDGYNINDLGNWNVDTRRDVYSAKLPMKAMRVMAGHPDEKGSVFLPRDHIKPSITLQQTIFPFIEKEIEYIDAATNSTAYYAFLNLLSCLRVIILQDAATMILNGRGHFLFTLDVFNCEEFKEFLKNMSHHLNLIQDPVDLRIDSILPGVRDRFTNLHSEMRANFSQLNDRVDGLVRPQHLQSLLNHFSSFDFSSSAQSSSSIQSNRSLNDQSVSTPVSAIHMKKNENGCPRYELYKNHLSCLSIWHEWFGTHFFDHNNNQGCFQGGIFQLEAKFKNQWRFNFTQAESKRFSRIKLVVKRIEALILKTNKTSTIILQVVDDSLTSLNSKMITITNIEQHLTTNFDYLALQISNQGLTSSPSATEMPAVKAKSVIKPTVEFELTANPAYKDHIPQTTVGTITEAIEVAKVAKVGDAYNSTLMTTGMCDVCGDIIIQLHQCIISYKKHISGYQVAGEQGTICSNCLVKSKRRRIG